MPTAPTKPTTPASESRVLKLSATEFRATKKADGSFEVAGYAAKFGVISGDIWGFREKIAPGAFSRAISEKQDATFLWMHKRDTLMARVKAGTLQLEADAVGLKFTAAICDCQDGRDLYARMSSGNVDQMSFTFNTIKDEWDFNGPIPIRTLLDVDLLDVSAVDEGAYPETELAMRSLEAARAKLNPPMPPPANLNANRRARLRILEAEAQFLAASH